LIDVDAGAHSRTYFETRVHVLHVHALLHAQGCPTTTATTTTTTNQSINQINDEGLANFGGLSTASATPPP
jgi:hypothetical protein